MHRNTDLTTFGITVPFDNEDKPGDKGAEHIEQLADTDR